MSSASWSPRWPTRCSTRASSRTSTGATWRSTRVPRMPSRWRCGWAPGSSSPPRCWTAPGCSPKRTRRASPARPTKRPSSALPRFATGSTSSTSPTSAAIALSRRAEAPTSRPRSAPRSDELRADLHVLREVTRAEEVVLDACLRGLTDAARALRVRQQSEDGGGERVAVGGIVEQDPADAVLDLILDAADAAGHHRSRLPHRLCDGQPESFGKALLDHDIGPPLQRVDHRGVLLVVIHGQADEVNTRFCLVG